MEPFPPAPPLASAPSDVVERGHLWLLELIDGGPLRFAVEPSGLISFGDAEREYADPQALPPAYRAAVRTVRDRLDRDGLREAVDDVGAVTFFGRASFRRSVVYDWDRMPPFLGYDVWTGDRWLPPDATEHVFDALGLAPAHVFEREQRARDFDPAPADAPRSAYYDGPAAGVLVRNKAGGRATWRNHHVLESEPDEEPRPTVEAFVERFTTPGRLQTIAGAEDSASDRGATIDRVLDAMYREAPQRLAGERGFDVSAVRAALVRELDTANDDR